MIFHTAGYVSSRLICYYIDYLANHALTIVFLVLFFVYLFLFVQFGLQFWKYRKSLR